MKIIRWLVLSGLFAGLTLWICAQTTTPSAPGQPPAKSELPTIMSDQANKSAAPAAPAPTAKSAAAKSKTPAKKKEEEPKIPGITVPRANGTFLGLEVEGGKFKLSFYDAKKKPMTPDVSRAAARWPNKRSATPNQYRTVLNPAGNALVGSQFVFPPYAFNVYLTLLQGDGDQAQAVENYVVPYHD
jgi:hypothetical protein